MRPMPNEKIERNRKIMDMRREGKTMPEIAREFGLTLMAVRNIVEREKHYDMLREHFPKILTGEYALSMATFNPLARHLRVSSLKNPEDELVEYILNTPDDELLALRNIGVKALEEIELWREHYAAV